MDTAPKELLINRADQEKQTIGKIATNLQQLAQENGDHVDQESIIPPANKHPINPIHQFDEHLGRVDQEDQAVEGSENTLMVKVKDQLAREQGRPGHEPAAQFYKKLKEYAIRKGQKEAA